MAISSDGREHAGYPLKVATYYHQVCQEVAAAVAGEMAH